MNNYKTDLPCIICSKKTTNGNCLHHLKARGSGGKDDQWNLIPVCFIDHTKYFHLKGLTFTADKFVRVKEFLIDNGWEFDELRNKWFHS